jgi:hypothetical protein
LLKIGNITDYTERPAAGCAKDKRIDLASIRSRIDDDGSATIRKRQRNRAADIAAGAGDNSDFACEFLGH